jgi:hypothetical protein
MYTRLTIDKKIAALSVVLCMFFAPSVLFAQEIGNIAKDKLDNSFVQETGVSKISLGTAVGSSVGIIFSILGTLFFIIVFYAGYRWSTAEGDEGIIGESKSTIIRATVGFVVVIGAYAITSFVVGTLTQESRTLAGSGTSTTDDTPSGPVGCCIDRTHATGRPGPSGMGVWTDRMETQSDCSVAGNDPNDASDVRYGNGTWGWVSTESLFVLVGNKDNAAVSCEALRQFQSGETYRFPTQEEWVQFMSQGINGRQEDGQRVDYF